MIDHFGEVCINCGGDMFVPGRPLKDEHDRVIGHRYVCADCGATAWVTWTDEYEKELEAAKARREEMEAVKARYEEMEKKACAANRQRHEDIRQWMREMREMEKASPAVRKYLAKQVCCYGCMDDLTPAWTHHTTWTIYEACKAIMEASA